MVIICQILMFLRTRSMWEVQTSMVVRSLALIKCESRKYIQTLRGPPE